MSDRCSPTAALGNFDIAVIGAGSAGFSAAITAAGEGAKVALIGHGTIGGTCVNVGCVPSKTMIRAAEALHGASVAARFEGIAGEAHVEDWSKVVRAKDDLVAKLRKEKYTDLLPDYNSIVYLDGPARLTDQGIAINGSEISVSRTIIATGSTPTVPDISGLSDVPFLDSTLALELTELPASLLVVGGGYIGCELAQMFSRSGVKVTLVTRSRLLPETEPEVSEVLITCLGNEGINVVTGLSYSSIRSTEQGVVLCVDRSGDQLNLEAEQLLITAGRSPNTAGLGLVDVGIDVNVRGGIAVDDKMRSSKPGVYAAGDVTGKDQFVYMAAYGAKLAALNALNSDSLSYDNSTMPWVVFTDPQVTGVGLTADLAQAKGFDTKTSLVQLDQLPRALAARDTRGLIKLVADAKTDRLLGGQIIAPEGADSIQTLAMALKQGMTAKELGDTIFPYLTTVEGLKLAAQSFGKDVTKLSCCAG